MLAKHTCYAVHCMLLKLELIVHWQCSDAWSVCLTCSICCHLCYVEYTLFLCQMCNIFCFVLYVYINWLYVPELPFVLLHYCQPELPSGVRQGYATAVAPYSKSPAPAVLKDSMLQAIWVIGLTWNNYRKSSRAAWFFSNVLLASDNVRLCRFLFASDVCRYVRSIADYCNCYYTLRCCHYNYQTVKCL